MSRLSCLLASVITTILTALHQSLDIVGLLAARTPAMEDLLPPGGRCKERAIWSELLYMPTNSVA
eukprot:1159810-Pelagomonas_calceolata.AAC.26